MIMIKFKEFEFETGHACATAWPQLRMRLQIDRDQSFKIGIAERSRV